MEHEYIDIDMRLVELNLSPSKRTLNCLHCLRIVTIKDLCLVSPNRLLEMRNFGHGSLDEVKKLLKKYGLHLEMDDKELEAYKKEYFVLRRWGVTNLAALKEQRRWELASQMLIHTKYDTQEILDIVSEFMEKYEKSQEI